MEKQFCSIKEAAEVLGLNKRTVAKHVATGLIPSVKIGKSRRIPVEAINRIRAKALTGGAK